MDFPELVALTVIFFFTAMIGVVTGSNSLITVPAMLHFGVEPRTALATNMLALTFLSVGGVLPFAGKGIITRHRLWLLIGLTMAGSIIGALLVLTTPADLIPILIAIFMLAIAGFIILNRNAGLVAAGRPSPLAVGLGYSVTFLLGIYGGFFSGGYVTLLTAVFVVWLGMTYLQAIATTKLINIFSSLIATLIFAWQGLIDWPLGLILSASMFGGAFIGARIAIKLDNAWLRRIFLVSVILLAIWTLWRMA